MLKILNVSFFILVGLFSTQIQARTITLNPKESKVLTNSGLWTVNAQCTIQGNQQTNSKIRIRVLKNRGSVNGRPLSAGQATSIRVRNNSNISVSAEAGTQINLVNMGSQGLQAFCNA